MRQAVGLASAIISKHVPGPVLRFLRKLLPVRATGLVLAVMVSMLAAMVLDLGCTSEASADSPNVPAAASQDHGSQSPISAKWHVAHCAAHCGGHMTAPQIATPVELPLPATLAWSPITSTSVPSRAPPVQPRPPRA